MFNIVCLRLLTDIRCKYMYIQFINKIHWVGCFNMKTYNLNVLLLMTLAIWWFINASYDLITLYMNYSLKAQSSGFCWLPNHMCIRNFWEKKLLEKLHTTSVKWSNILFSRWLFYSALLYNISKINFIFINFDIFAF